MPEILLLFFFAASSDSVRSIEGASSFAGLELFWSVNPGVERFIAVAGLSLSGPDPSKGVSSSGAASRVSTGPPSGDRVGEIMIAAD